VKTLIEVKLNDVINGVESMKYLMDVFLPAKTAYKVAKLAQGMENELKLFSDAREKLVRKYANKDENGEPIVDENNQITVTPDNIESYQKELNELLETEVKFDVNKIGIDELTNDISPNRIINLMPFIEE
jgi:hypothetical protein